MVRFTRLSGLSRRELRVLSDAESILDPEARWTLISTLLLTPDHDWDIHTTLYAENYAGSVGLAPAWLPTFSDSQMTNIGQIMASRGMSSYKDFYKWSITCKEEFWDACVKRVGISFAKSYSKVFGFPDSINQIKSPVYFPGASLNIAMSCFSKRRSHEVALISASELRPELMLTTFAELDCLSNRVANAFFDRLGLSVGDAVGVCMPLTVEAVAVYLGVIKAGGVVVSIADSFSSAEIDTRLKLGQAKVVFTVDVGSAGTQKIPVFSRVLDASPQRIVMIPVDSNGSASASLAPLLRPDCDLSWNEFLENASDRFSAVLCDPMDPCNILFSSGTTGDPKAIPWTHATPIKAAIDGYLHQDIRVGEVVAWPTNLGWMMGPWLIFQMINGATVALYNGFLNEKFCKFVEKARVNMLGVVPSLVKMWMTSDGTAGCDWRSIRRYSSTGEASGGAEMLWLMSRAHYAPVIEYCGGTEIGGSFLSSTMVQPNVPSLFSSAVLGSEFTLIDAEGREVDHGELALLPPALGLSTRLLNRDHHDCYYEGMPCGPNGATLRRHGDEVERVSSGGRTYYRAHGRCDDTMNLSGIKVSSIELERILNTVGGVRETAAVAVNPAQGGPSRLVVFAVLGQGRKESSTLKVDLQVALRSLLNPLFVISEVVVVEQLPRTASNKIMRRVLRDTLADSPPNAHTDKEPKLIPDPRAAADPVSVFQLSWELMDRPAMGAQRNCRSWAIIGSPQSPVDAQLAERLLLRRDRVFIAASRNQSLPSGVQVMSYADPNLEDIETAISTSNFSDGLTLLYTRTLAHQQNRTCFDHLEDVYRPLISVLKALEKRKTKCEVVVFTYDSISSTTSQSQDFNLVAYSLAGFFRALNLTNLVHVRQVGLDRVEVEAVLAGIDAIASTDETEITMREDLCFRPTLNSLTLKYAKPVFREDSGYLITGGLGGIGRLIVVWLCERGAGTVIINSRSAMVAEQLQWFEMVQASHPSTTLKHLCADVATEGSCELLIKDCLKFTSLRGVFHLAGSLHDLPLREITWEKYVAATSSKVNGAIYLRNSCDAIQSLDFVIMFSSVNSVLPLPSDLAYSSSNCFLDAMTQHSMEALRIYSINWGVWKSTGMMQSAVVPILSHTGCTEMLRALDSVMISILANQSQNASARSWIVAPLDADVQKYVDIYGDGCSSMMLRFAGTANGISFKSAASDSTQGPARHDNTPYLAVLANDILECIRRSLNNSLIGINDSFSDSGMDSLAAIQAVQQLKLRFPLHTKDLNVRNLLECDSASQLSSLLNKEQRNSENASLLNDVLRCLRQQLNCSTLSAVDALLDCGMDSLIAIHTVQQLKTRFPLFKKDLNVRVLFDCNTAEGLVNYFLSLTGSQVPAVPTSSSNPAQMKNVFAPPLTLLDSIPKIRDTTQYLAGPDTKVALLGDGGHAACIMGILHALGAPITGYYVPDKKSLESGQAHGTLASDIEENIPADAYLFPAIGVNKHRIAMSIRHADRRFCIVIHPTATIMDRETKESIGPGTVISAGVIIEPRCRIGSHVLIGLNVNIGHDTIIEDYAFVAAGTTLGGFSHIGKAAFCGLNSVVLPKVRIGDGATLAAMSLATTDIRRGVSMIGVPASPLESFAFAEGAPVI